MKHVSELEKTLMHFLDWHKSRVVCLVQILQALFCVRTVNLAQIALAFCGRAKSSSNYRRACRFFTNFSFDMSVIVSIVLRLFPLDDQYRLILDRTNWKWGKTPINILMLSVAYSGISIPLFWAVLDLEGNSSAKDRTSILRRALEAFGLEKIELLVADREFVGKEWFAWLVEKNIPFLIRVKKNFVGEGIEERNLTPLGKLYKGRKVINHPVNLWGHSLYVSAHRKRSAKEVMILASNCTLKDPFRLYKKRWEIETLFGCLKTRGFRMEDTHITNPDKIEKLIFVLAIAFCWAYRTGDIQARAEPIPIKSHGRKARSLFREGLDLIRKVILGGKNLKELRRVLECFNDLKPRGCG